MTQHTTGLVLSARIETKNELHGHIGVFQNGAKAGVLIVDAEYAEQISTLITAVSALLAACEDAKELYDYLALGPLGAAAKYGPDHDYDQLSDHRCFTIRQSLEDAIAIAKPHDHQHNRRILE